MDIAKLIDEAMIRKGMNQPALHRASQVPQATISRTLKGKTVPAIPTLRNLFTALDIPLSLLEQGASEQAAWTPAAPQHAPAQSVMPCTLESILACIQTMPPVELEHLRIELDRKSRLAALYPPPPTPKARHPKAA